MNLSLVNYLKENIDSSIKITKWKDQEKLPLFLLEIYSFYQMSILNKPCILMVVNAEVPAIDTIIKHMNVIRKISTDQMILGIKNITVYKRRHLIEAHIPFLIENGQMFLPFLGLDMKYLTNGSISRAEKFSPTAQLVYLFFLYNCEMQINATDLSKQLNVSVMTASRALNELQGFELLTYEIIGKTDRSKVYRRINDPDYYQRGATQLKNPIRKTVYMKALPETCPIAGLEALANQTMINGPQHPVRAISKEMAKQLKSNLSADQDELFNKDYYEVQIWNYSPNFLCSHHQVDVLSLALSFESNNDDRIDIAIQSMLEGESWYRD